MWWKMIDSTPQVWQTRISPRILQLRFNMHRVKRWLTPHHYDWPRSQVEFASSDLACTWSKDDWSPQVWQTRISPRILKLRFNMHMVKRWLTPPGMTDQIMDLASNWPWRTLLHERPFTREGNYLVWVKYWKQNISNWEANISLSFFY